MDITQLFTVLGSATAEESTGIAALGIDPLAIAAQAATFLVLFWIVKKFALKNIVATLEKRRQTIDDGVRLGQKMEAEQAELEVKIEEVLHKARLEADTIIAASHNEAGSIIKQAETDASTKADLLLSEAKVRIDENIVKARKQLEQEMLSLVAEATEAIINEKLDAKKDASLIQRVLQGVRS